MAGLSNSQRAALRSAGADALPAPSRAKLAARVARFGYLPSAHNLGRLLCRIPHEHGQADADGIVRCVLDRGEYVRSFRSDDDGARTLVALMAHDPTVAREVSGFRSTFTAGGGTRQHDGSAAGGVLDWMNPFHAPSEDAEHAFKLLWLDWMSYEAAGVPDGVQAGVDAEGRTRWGYLKPTHDAWVSFRDAWISGNPDTTALSAMAADADRVRRELATADPKWGDPDHGAAVKVPDVAESTPLLKLAAAVSDEAKKIPGMPGAKPIPWYYKAGGGAALFLLALGAVRR